MLESGTACREKSLRNFDRSTVLQFDAGHQISRRPASTGQHLRRSCTLHRASRVRRRSLQPAEGRVSNVELLRRRFRDANVAELSVGVVDVDVVEIASVLQTILVLLSSGKFLFISTICLKIQNLPSRGSQSCNWIFRNRGKLQSL